MNSSAALSAPSSVLSLDHIAFPRQITRLSADRLELDLADVPYLRSSHLKQLLTLQREVRSRRQQLIVTGIDTPKMEMLLASGFDQLLTIQ